MYKEINNKGCEVMIFIDKYVKSKVYVNPQILIFENVPCDIIKFVTK